MTLVKICGINNLTEAKKASELGADFIGVLIDIPQTNLSVSKDIAKEISEELPNKVIILTIETNPEKLESIISYVKPYGVQLLRPSLELIKKLKNKTKVIPVIHINKEFSFSKIKEFSFADMILLDSCEGEMLGGTGKIHNWDLSKQIVNLSNIPVILAGGLNSNNIKKAISKVTPFGVDVESSLRNKEGYRDFEKVKEFIILSKSN